MTERPRVSVLMTVYNAAPWLGEAVRSVIAQTFAHWTLIAVDDGSTDGSVDILESFHDSRIRVVVLPHNIGRTPALRQAFDLASTELLAVLDADDVWEPTLLARTVAYLDAHADTTLVGTWATQIDPEGREIGAFEPPTDPAALLDSFAWQNPIVHSTAVYRADVARRVGGYPADVHYAQDLGLWLRLAGAGPVGMIGERLARHRTVASSMTMAAGTRQVVARDTLDLLRLAHATLPLSAVARRRGRAELGVASLRYVSALLRARHYGSALRALAGAVLHHPRALLWNRVYRDALLG